MVSNLSIRWREGWDKSTFISPSSRGLHRGVQEWIKVPENDIYRLFMDELNTVINV
jgi:hypothetical protein